MGRKVTQFFAPLFLCDHFDYGSGVDLEEKLKLSVILWEERLHNPSHDLFSRAIIWKWCKFWNSNFLMV